MTRKHPEDLETWLRAESAGDSERADRALAGLMQRLPLAQPSAGFAGRVLQRAGIGTPVRVAVDLFAWTSVRWAIGLGLVLAAASLLFVPTLLQPLVSAVSLSGVLGALTQVIVQIGRWIGAGAAFWRVAGELGSTCALVVSKPPIALLLLAMAGMGAAALRVLNRLMSPERSAAHA
ncbi:MAG: hypothetical protein ABI609_06590 [Acidobacteriota bacterium]